MNLTNQQLQAARSGKAVTLTADGESFVLLSKDVFDRVRRVVEYDDGEWTDEELRRLAARTFEEADNAEPIP